jgi:hypothetical protein
MLRVLSTIAALTIGAVLLAAGSPAAESRQCGLPGRAAEEADD